MATIQELRTELRVSDVLKILKDLGGSATPEQIRLEALKSFSPETVSQYLGRRLEQLVKWREVERHCQLRQGRTTYTILQRDVKSLEEIAKEENQALKNIVLLKHNRRKVPESGRNCGICLERLTIFDDISNMQRWRYGRRHTVYFHKKCSG